MIQQPMEPIELTRGERDRLRRAAVDLQERYAGVFGLETIEQLLVRTAEHLVERSTVYNRFRGVLFERLAAEQLEAMAKSRGRIGAGVPAVLFLCVHNAGRSQMALGWFAHLAAGQAYAWSGGSEPSESINPSAVAAMAEVGVDISTGYAKPWTDEVLEAADVVVTMGCGDACPLRPGKRYEDWDIEDPDGRTLEEVRVIRDTIGLRVLGLLEELGITPDRDRLPDPTGGP